MRCKRTKPRTGWWIPVLLLLSPLQGQSPSELAQRLAENSSALRQYTWTMRAEVRINNQESVGLYKMRYDLDGRLQRTPMSGGEQEEQVSPELLALARAAIAYAQPRPNIFQAFMSTAEMWEGRGSGQGTVRIEGSGMMVADDSVTITVVNGRARKMEVRSSLQDQAIFVTADYQTISNGPTHVARLTVSQPATGMELKIENFDYIGTAPAARKVVIATGTTLHVRLAQPLSTKKNKTGQTFEAILDQDIAVNGQTVVPRGARLVGRLSEVKQSGRVSGLAKMVLTLTTLHLETQAIAIQTTDVTLEAEGSKGRDARRIAGGAGLGALIGAIADGGGGAAKGAAIGAGVGTAATLITRGKEVEISAEHPFSFGLKLPLEIIAG